MKTIEIHPDHWRHFCERLTEQNHESMVSIQFEDAGVTHVIVDNEPLRSVVLDEDSNSCSDLLVIEAGASDTRPSQHRIVQPIHMKLRNGQNERYNRVEIRAENGTTVISLRPGVAPALVKELEEAMSRS